MPVFVGVITQWIVIEVIPGPDCNNDHIMRRPLSGCYWHVWHPWEAEMRPSQQSHYIKPEPLGEGLMW